MDTLVSLIIRTFNNEKTILRSLNSALRQSYTNLEVILVNDGSTDKTIDISKSIFDTRLKIIEQKNLGAISAAYKGIENAKGERITFLDADDELMPDAIKYLCKHISSKMPSYSYCDYIEKNVKTSVKKYVSLSNINNILACGVMFHQEIIDNVGFWDKSFILPEYDYIYRVGQHYNGIHIKMPLYKYNRQKNSFTSDIKLIDKAKEQIFSKYGEIPNFKKY